MKSPKVAIKHCNGFIKNLFLKKKKCHVSNVRSTVIVVYLCLFPGTSGGFTYSYTLSKAQFFPCKRALATPAKSHQSNQAKSSHC